MNKQAKSVQATEVNPFTGEVAETKATAVAVVRNDDSFAPTLMEQADLGSFYSLNPTTKEGKVALYNAINNPDKRLADFINMEIEVTDVIVEIVELEQESTGEIVKCPRIILIDKAGVSYQCVSVGVFSGLKKIIKLFGVPTWNEPVRMRVKQVSKAERKMLSLELV